MENPFTSRVCHPLPLKSLQVKYLPCVRGMGLFVKSEMFAVQGVCVIVCALSIANSTLLNWPIVSLLIIAEYIQYYFHYFCVSHHTPTSSKPK